MRTDPAAQHGRRNFTANARHPPLATILPAGALVSARVVLSEAETSLNVLRGAAKMHRRREPW